MDLTKLVLQNFRAFPQAEWQLPSNGLVLVVGGNNAGKSSLLSSIDAVRQGSWPGARRLGAPSGAVLSALFSLSRDERVAAIARAVGNEGSPEALVDTTNLLASIQLVFRDDGDSTLSLGEVHSSDHNGQLTLMGRASNGQFDAISLQEVVGQGLHGPRWPLSTRSAGSHSNAVQGLARFDLFPTFASLLETWRSRVFHFDPIRMGTQTSRTLASSEWLEPSGVNLPEALRFINTNGHPAWERVRAVMQDTIPDLGILHTRTNNDRVSVVFTDPYLELDQNLKTLGTGVEQILMTAYVGERHPAGGVVLVEEPESHLHPEAQRRLLVHLLRWATERLVILSTHSTVFLDRAAGHVPTWLVQRQSGASSLRQTEAYLPEVLDALGVRLSDVLTADRVLAVEGDPDADIVRHWYSHMLNEHRVRVVPGRRGGIAAFHIETFAAWLDEWLGTTHPDFARLMFLRDRDELDDDTVARLEGTGVVAVLKRREIENYLLDPMAVADVLSERLTEGGRGGEPPTHSELCSQMRRAADELRPTITLKRVAAALKSIRLIDQSAVQKLCDEGRLTVDAFLNEVETRLPDKARKLTELRENWVAIEAEVAAGWETDWTILAPGADILSEVWKSAGLRFNKGRDPLLLAQRVDPPAELTASLAKMLQSTP